MRFWSERLPALSARMRLVLSRLPVNVEPLPLLRRVAIVLAGLCIAGYIGRHAIAYGLVARGDDILRGGSTIVHWGEPASLVYYERAHRFDPQWDVPVDRFAFAASMTFDRPILQRGIAVAGAYLQVHPQAFAIRRSRAFCAVHLGDFRSALGDVRVLAAAAPADWRLTAMQAGLEHRAGHDTEAAALWAKANHVRASRNERRASS